MSRIDHLKESKRPIHHLVPRSGQNRIPEMIIDKTAPVLGEKATSVLKDQWKRFWQLRFSGGENKMTMRVPRIGDGMLLHQLQYGEAVFVNILKSGILSGELGYAGKKTKMEQSETSYCADFFVNYGEKSVHEYIVLASSKQKVGRLSKDRMERYLCPNENNENMAVVIDPANRELAALLCHSATSINANTLADFAVRFPIGPDRLESAKRHLAVLVGIPANFTSFLIIGGELASDSAKLARLKSIISDSGLEIPVVNYKGEPV